MIPQEVLLELLQNSCKFVEVFYYGEKYNLWMVKMPGKVQYYLSDILQDRPLGKRYILDTVEDIYMLEDWRDKQIDDIIKYGINPIILINKINDDLQHCNTIIGHNILFDIRKIYQYAEKFNMIFDYSNKKIVCTMKESRKYDIARDKNNRIKNPTLNELCGHFKIVPDKDKFHDASYDVFMTLQCYICLIKTKMINTK